MIKKQSILNYTDRHASGKSSFRNWMTAIKFAEWFTPEDIKQTFGTSDLLGNGSNRVVFNIGGNNYRLICKYYFSANQVHLFVCWIGTHAEYDELCSSGKQFTVNVF